MKRAIILTAAIVAFAGGMFARDYVNEAHATNVGTPRATLAGIGAGTSAQLASALTDETGTAGAVVFSASPTLTGTVTVTGSLGVSGVLTVAGGVVGNTGVFSSTSGTALIVTGQGSSDGATFSGGSGSSAFAGRFTGATSNAGGAYAIANGAGIAVRAEATGGGPALYLDGDETSPAQALIQIAGLQDANPSGSVSTGNLTVVSSNSIGLWRTATASTTWNDVAGILTQRGSLTAFAGGGQASATAVCTTTETATVTTVASAGDSVKLPATPAIGQLCEVVNDAATNAMNLFPGSGDVLCVAGSGCLAPDAATSITVSQHIRVCRALSAAKWVCH